MLRRVCVFCGSSPGNDPVFARTAAELGVALATEQLELVYGGGRVGLMGALADACLAAGGRVTGVIPQDLWDLEIGHDALTELRIATDMHERKATMASLADGFLALPGGFGTYEELFEQLTWLQLGHHRKPVVVLDLLGFYDPLFQLLETAERAGFMKPIHTTLVQRAGTVSDALAMLRNPTVEPVPKWIRA